MVTENERIQTKDARSIKNLTPEQKMKPAWKTQDYICILLRST